MRDWEDTIEALLEAVPYLRRYKGKTVVVKYGGSAMLNEQLKDTVMRDLVLLRFLGIKPVLSHGGGPGINRMLDALHIPTRFVDGLRYTSEETMRVVEAVLIGQVNTGLVGLLNKFGGRAMGLSGVSGELYHCYQLRKDLGFVGEIDCVNADAVRTVQDAGFLPVVAPVGTDGEGHTYNINGDTAAAKLAGALGAEALLLLTDIEGLCNSVEQRDVIRYLNVRDVPGLKEKGVIAGGMIPKIDGCVQAIAEGVGSVHIVDGREPHSILRALFTGESVGTTIGTEHGSVGIRPA